MNGVIWKADPLTGKVNSSLKFNEKIEFGKIISLQNDYLININKFSFDVINW